MAEIQLKSNWAGYTPGSIVTVSDVRGRYLVNELKIARYTHGQIEKNKAEEAAKAKEEDSDKAKASPDAKKATEEAAKAKKDGKK